MKPLLKGNHIKNKLNIKNGPIIGQLIKESFEYQMLEN